jgi:hypothetical protein
MLFPHSPSRAVPHQVSRQVVKEIFGEEMKYEIELVQDNQDADEVRRGLIMAMLRGSRPLSEDTAYPAIIRDVPRPIVFGR